MSSRDIGNKAEAMSAAQDEAEGFVCHKQNFNRFGKKDLLATDERIGFDRVCVKPNELTRWTQCKHRNTVSVAVLKDLIQWEADFNVDGIPTAKVYLDVWDWVEANGSRDMVMERWDLVKMMSELAHREFNRERRLAEKKLEEAHAVEDKEVDRMIEDINAVEPVVQDVKGVTMMDLDNIQVTPAFVPNPPEDVETFFITFKPVDKPEEVKEKVNEGIKKVLSEEEIAEQEFKKK